MNEPKKTTCELGPIRPPSEALSLLIRVSRNCPWNKCAFCPVYKNEKFSRRPEEDVIEEIDIMARAAKKVHTRTRLDAQTGKITPKGCLAIVHDPTSTDLEKRIALWLHRGGEHVFLQDADSLIVPAHRVERILHHLYEQFPSVNRVTTYARSRTLAAKSVDQLKSLRKAGLTRIHVGVETGANEVLELVKKGCTPKHHIEGCKRAIEAGFEVCCYVMPGLGGKRFTGVHARETGTVLKEISPHHIRLRSLYILPGSPLGDMFERGEFELVEEEDTVREIQTMLKILDGADSKIVSDHDFNLLMEIEGHVTEDSEKLQGICNQFFELPPETRDAFVVARRSGYFRSLHNFLSDPRAIESFITTAAEIKTAGSGSLAKGIALKMGIRSI